MTCKYYLFIILLVNINNITNSFQSNLTKFKSKISNISINNNNNSQDEETVEVRSRSIDTKSVKPGIVREFSNSLFSFYNKENKENYNTNNIKNDSEKVIIIKVFYLFIFFIIIYKINKI